MVPSFWTNNLPKLRNSFRHLLHKHFANHPPDNIVRALEFCENSHRGQVRKGTGAPYAIHPIRVAYSIIEEFGVCDLELICAALVHDTLEDTDTDVESLRAEFSPRCAELVRVVSRLPGEERGKGGDHLRDSYLRRIASAGRDAVLLKLADKIDNLRDAINHPDPVRVSVFINETFSTYIPLAESLPPAMAKRAERLLLESVASAAPELHPRLLKALIESVEKSLLGASGNWTVLPEIAVPEIAAKAYLYLNPLAEFWLDFDGVSLAATRLPRFALAAKIAQSLRETILGPNLDSLLRLVGMPVAFSSLENRKLWQRAAGQLSQIQSFFRSPDRLPWLDHLLDESNLPLVNMLVQSRVYAPAGWRSPLWAEDLGASLSRRMAEIRDSSATSLFAIVLSNRLALIRNFRGTGTVTRAEAVFHPNATNSYSADSLWALRLTAEYLELTSLGSGEDDAASEEQARSELLRLWDQVKSKPYGSRSLPRRGREGEDASGALDLPEWFASVEVIGIHETRSVFESAGAGAQFQALVRALLLERPKTSGLRWIRFDSAEWQKRKRYWSAQGQLRIADGSGLDDSERSGVRLLRRTVLDAELITVLPARRFALMDRLPEIDAEALGSIERKSFTVEAIFDELIFDSKKRGRDLWVPRVYRILDTLEDLDPEGVQAILVSYEGPHPIPPLRALLPLPAGDSDAAQLERKRFLARYLVAQIYNCGVVRWVRKVTFSCSPVATARGRHSFTEQELACLVSEAERDYGYRQGFANYLERYGFEPFSVEAGASLPAALPFGQEALRHGVFLGIDIGGSYVKFGMFRDGAPFAEKPLQIATPVDMEVGEFARRILFHISDWLRNSNIGWEDVQGIGVSWPGGVRGNHIVAMSGLLRRLKENGQPFRDHDPINRLPELDLAGHFQSELRTHLQASRRSLSPDFTVAMLNDGDAEALGNHALRVLQNVGKPGGKIFIKMGTSIAGGRITDDGEVAEEVGEYAKVVLNLGEPPNTQWPNGTARKYAAAAGVRHLSRTFQFRGEPLFGDRNGANADDAPSHIEPLEIGELLALLSPVHRETLLKELVVFDNQPSSSIVQPLLESTESALRGSLQPALVTYIRARGSDSGQPEGGWNAGLRRTIWLCTGKDYEREDTNVDEIPLDFPFTLLARAVVGSVSLFSQLALQTAHLIAQLYNVYRRDTFTEVVLSGGVLSGQTGVLVIDQVKAFLLKYYDKIYGKGRPLGTDTILRAGSKGLSNPGLFGAAMAANRLRLTNIASVVAAEIEARLKRVEVGEVLHVDTLSSLAASEKLKDFARRILDFHVASGNTIWLDENHVRRIK